MLKYLDSKVTLQEVPEEISLCISITGCKIHCKGCHTPELWKDCGTPLTNEAIDKLISENNGITCICLMGGEHSPRDIASLADYIHTKNLKVAWYCGNRGTSLLEHLDFIKIGPYKKDLGGLTSPKTNQRFYKVERFRGKLMSLFDLTDKFTI